METNQKDPGQTIQDYVRGKWRRSDVALSVEELGRQLDPSLRDRVDLLGIDDQKLLAVDPQDVLSRIEGLEREAQREDSRVSEHKKSIVLSNEPSRRPPSRPSNRPPGRPSNRQPKRQSAPHSARAHH